MATANDSILGLYFSFY